ncbi:GspE/PulE family protein [Tepidicella xavieri]|uniref:Type II secretory ATPase GspE/PulE/Tfp pilus assembly ATPase PilB-like protein n=1 Tax=Tepidicella xavieri TaxID=360241 RepID=A0A4R6UEF7_9BURK|nr:ATPase, T2SS/T4P/T4SS family [Tepidicella xavieri]TDQ45111.1 type II secretory ATPase GspE/PulE/Tfp pilus assembly ATPase PilB-like protein [Tepidicella xavieri]
MNASIPTTTPAPRDATLPPLRWPTPPYASYGEQPTSSPDGLPCLAEGSNGHARPCLLKGLDLKRQVALIQVPPSKAVMALRFDMFRRITITEPLFPQAIGQAGSGDSAFGELLSYRPRLPYRLLLKDGQEETGTTIGHVESEAGWFLFIPLNEQDQVQRVFIPREMVQALHVGEAIGQVLVEQQAVTPEQVEIAAREQENLRNRKLGDYLVIKEIVKPEQLLMALEEQARMPMVRIGEALTALGLITQAQLDEALQRQKSERSVPLGELLVQSGQLSREDLRIALARKMGYPVVDLAQFPVDAEAVRRVPIALARRHRIVPLLWRNGMVVVAAEDPSKRGMLEELEFSLQSKVVAALASGNVTPQTVSQVYARFGLDEGGASAAPEAPPEGSLPSAGKLLESLEMEVQDDAELAAAQIEQSDNSLVKLINSIIIEAHGQGASDIHIETHPGKRKIRIRLRKDGRLVPYMELPHTYRAAIVGRIKVMCELDISERRKPQDGKIDFAKFSPHHKLELRVATIPTLNGAEDVVMRLLSSAKPLPLDQLGLTPRNLQHLQAAVERPHGMVLCVGPTGSGKTTTLHSLLQHINTPDRKIWTAEDPVEISNPDLRQVQVNPKIDWTFAKALRAFLRADPDVIMVGEIRDEETAQVAIEASLTGHLVLSTLHTNSAPETVVRLLDMGMDPFNFADSLEAVLAQRLVRRLCPNCVQARPADDAWVDELLDDYLHVFPEALRPSKDALREEWRQQFGQEGRLVQRHAPGCPSCDQSGLKGRVGVHELLVVDAALRRLIQRKAPSEALQESAMATQAFRTLRQDGILKVLQGLTTIDEVRANTVH